MNFSKASSKDFFKNGQLADRVPVQIKCRDHCHAFGHHKNVFWRKDSLGRVHHVAVCESCDSYQPIAMEKDITEVELHFGKYKGTLLIDAPISYIRWLLENTDPSLTQRNRYLEAIKHIEREVFGERE